MQRTGIARGLQLLRMQHLYTKATVLSSIQELQFLCMQDRNTWDTGSVHRGP